MTVPSVLKTWLCITHINVPRIGAKVTFLILAVNEHQRSLSNAEGDDNKTRVYCQAPEPALCRTCANCAVLKQNMIFDSPKASIIRLIGYSKSLQGVSVRVNGVCPAINYYALEKVQQMPKIK